MVINKKLILFEEIFGPSTKEGQNQYLFFCPKCKHHKPKLSINFEKGGKCWFCDFKSPDLTFFVKKFGNQEQLNQWLEISGLTYQEKRRPKNLFLKIEKEEKKIKVELPEDFRSLVTTRKLALNLLPLKYLKTRNIFYKDITKWKIGFSLVGEYKNRIIIPSFNNEGELDYFISRTYVDNFTTYKNPPISHDIIFNELSLDWDEDIILVEGVFDAIVAGNAIPLLTSTLRENSYIFSSIIQKKKEIFLALDPDAKRKELKIIELFKKYGVDVFKISVSPFKDVGEMSKEQFSERKKGAVLLNSKNILSYRLAYR